MRGKGLKIAAIVVLAACYITFLRMFLLMYLSPRKTMYFGVNVYGEAVFEAIILLVSAPICAKYLYVELKSSITNG